MALLHILHPTNPIGCKVCCKDVLIKHQGALDIERHSESKTHRQRIVSTLTQTQLRFNKTQNKIRIKQPCYSFKPSKELLQKAKKATSYYNKELCSSRESTSSA